MNTFEPENNEAQSDYAPKVRCRGCNCYVPARYMHGHFCADCDKEQADLLEPEPYKH